MNTRLRIKFGSIELEYEGATELSPDNIKDLISHFETLAGVSLSLDGEDTHVSESAASPRLNGADKSQSLHVNSVAAKLGASSGPEIAEAAAAYLQISRGREKFSRQELLQAMQEATQHYNQNMSKNLTQIINRLVASGKINQLSSDSFALEASNYTRIESQLRG